MFWIEIQVRSLLLSVTQAVAVCVLLAGCEAESSNYATWKEADQAQLISSGWIPGLVPRTAYAIYEEHDLDLNTQHVEFTVPLQDIAGMTRGQLTLTPNDRASAAYGLRVDWLQNPDSPVDGFVVCSEMRPAVLFVNRKTGKAVFSTAGTWADRYCEGK